jgi:uncharacterized protein (TIGR03089 family)
VPATPDDVTGLLRALMASDPGRPRLTWYGPGGERVELSARTLDNWVAKTANLLTIELDAGPGTRVLLALPAHWRSAVWTLATWSVGACAVVGSADGAAADVVVTTAEQARAWSTSQVVAVALPALAATAGPDLPPGAHDGAALVRVQADVFVPLVSPVAGDPAFAGTGPPVRHVDLMPRARRTADERGWSGGVRVLTDARPDEAVGWLLGPLSLDGSVVLHPAPALGDAPERDRIAEQEGVTARW